MLCKQTYPQVLVEACPDLDIVISFLLSVEFEIPPGRNQG